MLIVETGADDTVAGSGTNDAACGGSKDCVSGVNAVGATAFPHLAQKRIPDATAFPHPLQYMLPPVATSASLIVLTFDQMC